MTQGNKTISNSNRPQIDTLKCMIRYSTRPFDGTGYPFYQALKELRKEGLSIRYNRSKCNYQLISHE